MSVLTITNDGVAERPSGRAAGTGLAGLRERLADVGGRLETAADASEGRFVRSRVSPGVAVTELRLALCLSTAEEVRTSTT